MVSGSYGAGAWGSWPAASRPASPLGVIAGPEVARWLLGVGSLQGDPSRLWMRRSAIALSVHNGRPPWPGPGSRLGGAWPTTLGGLLRRADRRANDDPPGRPASPLPGLFTNNGPATTERGPPGLFVQAYRQARSRPSLHRRVRYEPGKVRARADTPPGPVAPPSEPVASASLREAPWTDHHGSGRCSRSEERAGDRPNNLRLA